MNRMSFLKSLFHQSPTIAPRRAGRAGLQFEVLEERLTLNNRFVVPLDVPADLVASFHSITSALEAPGLVSGDIVEIKQGAEPGGLLNSSIPNITNLTLRGEAAVGPQDLGVVTFTDAVTIPANRQGFQLQNLNLTVNATLTVSAGATLSNSAITLSPSNGAGIVVTATGTVVIMNNKIAKITQPSWQSIDVTSSAGSQNLIAGNYFTQSTSGAHIYYAGSGATQDVIRNNTLISNEGNTAAPMIFVNGGVNGLTIRQNTFRDADLSAGAIGISYGAQNIRVLFNTIELSGTVSLGAIVINSGAAGLATSVTIAGNIISVGALSRGILIAPFSPGTLSARVEGNDFLAGAIGITIGSNGADVGNIDLGGGTQGSAGGNNFRFVRSAATATSGAIIALAGTGSVQARNNLFNSLGAEAAVFDNGDDATRADVVTTGNLTGNAAFVQALFVRFLHRTGDVNNPNDAGGFVTELNNGASPGSIVNAIARSAEAFGYVVDDLYHTIMNRDADPAGRMGWVNHLVGGGTLESVRGGFFASPEYASRFAADREYVVSLYSTVLHRVGGDSEYAGWVAQLPSLGRAAVAASISNSAEAHGQAAARLYLSILKRTAGAAEISGWANSGLDELSILANIAASSEGQGIL